MKCRKTAKTKKKERYTGKKSSNITQKNLWECKGKRNWGVVSVHCFPRIPGINCTCSFRSLSKFCPDKITVPRLGSQAVSQIKRAALFAIWSPTRSSFRRTSMAFDKACKKIWERYFENALTQYYCQRALLKFV